MILRVRFECKIPKSNFFVFVTLSGSLLCIIQENFCQHAINRKALTKAKLKKIIYKVKSVKLINGIVLISFGESRGNILKNK